jgi:hypothetical protein
VPTGEDGIWDVEEWETRVGRLQGRPNLGEEQGIGEVESGGRLGCGIGRIDRKQGIGDLAIGGRIAGVERIEGGAAFGMEDGRRRCCAELEGGSDRRVERIWGLEDVWATVLNAGWTDLVSTRLVE